MMGVTCNPFLHRTLSPPSPPKGDKPMRLFIVEDSALVRERMVNILSNLEGIEIVGQAEDVSQATESIHTSKPDLVILDIKLREGFGIDVLKNIKQERPSTKVIILTNYPKNYYKELYSNAGADFFFDKATEFRNVLDVCGRLARSG